MRLRIVQCMIDFVRRTKFDSYQTRSPPFGRLKVSKGDAGGMAGGEEGCAGAEDLKAKGVSCRNHTSTIHRHKGVNSTVLPICGQSRLLFAGMFGYLCWTVRLMA